MPATLSKPTLFASMRRVVVFLGRKFVLGAALRVVFDIVSSAFYAALRAMSGRRRRARTVLDAAGNEVAAPPHWTSSPRLVSAFLERFAGGCWRWGAFLAAFAGSNAAVRAALAAAGVRSASTRAVCGSAVAATSLLLLKQRYAEFFAYTALARGTHALLCSRTFRDAGVVPRALLDFSYWPTVAVMVVGAQVMYALVFEQELLRTPLSSSYLAFLFRFCQKTQPQLDEIRSSMRRQPADVDAQRTLMAAHKLPEDYATRTDDARALSRCCRTMHPGMTCERHAVQFIRRQVLPCVDLYGKLFLFSNVVRSLVELVTSLRRRRTPATSATATPLASRALERLVQLAKNTLRSSAMFTTLTVVGWYGTCVFVRTVGRDCDLGQLRYRLALKAFLLPSGLSTLIDVPSRRLAIALYCMPILLQSIGRELAIDNPTTLGRLVTERPEVKRAAETALFALGTSTIGLLHAREKRALAGFMGSVASVFFD